MSDGTSTSQQPPDQDPPWPYEDAPADETSEPTWECPGGECDCHAKSEEEPRVDHTIVLYDSQGKRMGGARVRVFENGRLITEPSAKSTGGGEVNIQIRKSTASLRVEWAPATLPKVQSMPFRRRYHVALGTDPGVATDKRLWNLGFGQRRLRDDNIRDYQTVYKQERTGKLHDVYSDVAQRHDDADVHEFPPPAPPEDGPHSFANRSSFMPVAFHSQDRNNLLQDDGGGSSANPPGGVGASSGGQNTKGALVAAAGHLWFLVAYEPKFGPLKLDDIVVRVCRKPDPGKEAYEHGPHISPTGAGVVGAYQGKNYASFAFIDLPVGEYTAMAYIKNVPDSARTYALGSAPFEVKQGLLSVVYVGTTATWPIRSVADPLLDLDVPIMQRRRKTLAAYAHFFPMSTDLQAKKKGKKAPYDQGDYGPCYIQQTTPPPPGMPWQNNCAPVNNTMMGIATGTVDPNSGKPIPGAGATGKYGYDIDVSAGYTKWVEGLCPSVGDSFFLADDAGAKHHSGMCVGTSPFSGDLWLCADGGQPDKTTDFQDGKEGWRRYYNPPHTNSSDACYVLPRVFGRKTGATLGNAFIFPTSTGGGYNLPGWADLTHPGVPFAKPAYDKNASEADYKKMRKLVLDVEKKVTADRIRCAALKQAATAANTPVPQGQQPAQPPPAQGQPTTI
ncbi:MAG: hypothetical protein IPK82_36185 [Polyangiaceae bacterium]|nr:hypothetical protein [Polyangiaceae bacterium]